VKPPIPFLRSVLPLLLIICSASLVARAQDQYAAVNKWESFDFGAKGIAPADIIRWRSTI